MPGYFCLQMEELLGGVHEEIDTSTTGNRISTVKWFFPHTEAMIGPSPEHLDRTDENRGVEGAPPKLIDNYAPGGRLQMRAYPNLLVPLWVLAGYTATIAEGDGTNEVQQVAITGSPTGGTFTLTFSGQTTVAIPYNATATQVREALEGLRAFRPGDVVVAGGALPGTPITITFEGRYSATNVATLTHAASLTGGTSPAVAITTPTAGVVGTVADPDGNGLPADAYRVTFTKRTGPSAKTGQFIAAYEHHSTFIWGSGYGVSQLGFGATGEVTAELMGIYARRGPNPGYTKALDAASVLPLRRGDFSLSWLGGGARIQDWTVSVANPVERGDHLGFASYYPKALDRTGSPVKHSGTIAKGQLDPDDYDAMVNAGTFSAVGKWVGQAKIGTTGKSYGMWLEYPAAQIVGGDAEAMSNAPRTPASYEWEGTYDELAGTDCEITVVCGVQQIEAFA